MLQPRLWIKIVAVIVMLASGACKTRDPEAAGVLSYQPSTLEDSQEAFGTINIVCTPAPGVEGDPMAVRYLFTIAGAVSDTDEGQPVLVTVEREMLDNGFREPLSSYEAGRGAVSKSGSIFLGFPSGVLTANYGAASMGSSTHGGVMTLSTDASATALSVNCTVADKTKKKNAPITQYQNQPTQP